MLERWKLNLEEPFVLNLREIFDPDVESRNRGLSRPSAPARDPTGKDALKVVPQPPSQANQLGRPIGNAKGEEGVVVSFEDNEFYWSQISDDDRAYLCGPRHWPERCVWCRRFYHSAACQEMHNSWRIRMPFGKHKGKPVNEVDREYLRWLVKSGRLQDAELHDEVVRVLGESPSSVGPDNETT